MRIQGSLRITEKENEEFKPIINPKQTVEIFEKHKQEDIWDEKM